MVSLDFECIRAPFCGWCDVGDVEPMLLDDVYWPEDLTIEGEAASPSSSLPRPDWP